MCQKIYPSSFDARISNLMKTEKKREDNEPEKILSAYDEENSKNENSTSRENAGAELDVCTGFTVCSIRRNEPSKPSLVFTTV